MEGDGEREREKVARLPSTLQPLFVYLSSSSLQLPFTSAEELELPAKDRKTSQLHVHPLLPRDASN